MDRLSILLDKWNSLKPLAKEDKLRLDRKFMLEFNYNSNHIEGNTLTYGQTELLLLFGKVVNEANMKDLEEMKAHNVCLQMMVSQAQDKSSVLSETFIRQLHTVMLREDYTVYRQLPGGDTTSYVVHAGCYKTRPNSVITPTGERFEYASPEETPALMYDLISWYNQEESKGELTPIELAALFHYRYIRIHPFEDGNGRIARLLVNYILLKHDYPMVVVRSKLKKDYLKAIDIYTDYYIDKMWDNMVGSLSEGDYYWAFFTLYCDLDHYAEEYQEYLTNPDYISPYASAHMNKGAKIAVLLAGSAVMSLVIAFTGSRMAKSRNNNVRPYTDGRAYLKEGGCHFKKNRDTFASTHTSIVPIPRDDNHHHGGGGSWGGPSSTFSGGGRSFGGGGGKF